MAVRSSGSLTQASAASSFWVRYAARYLLNASCPALLGPRDRLCHFDTQPPWMPDLPLGRFVGSALTVFDLPDQADAVRAFLEFWLPVQALRVLQRVLIEFSVTAGESGLGLMLYGNNLTMTQAFVKYCRQHGLGGETSELCRAICATFRPSDLGMVRAEFRRGGPTRQSIAASWLFDTLREHDALAEQLRRLRRKRDSRPSPGPRGGSRPRSHLTSTPCFSGSALTIPGSRASCTWSVSTTIARRSSPHPRCGISSQPWACRKRRCSACAGAAISSGGTPSTK